MRLPTVADVAAWSPERLRAHTLHLASTLRAPAFAHEFSEFSLFLDDPFDGLALERGSVGVPSGSGTGVHMRDANS